MVLGDSLCVTLFEVFVTLLIVDRDGVSPYIWFRGAGLGCCGLSLPIRGIGPVLPQSLCPVVICRRI